MKFNEKPQPENWDKKVADAEASAEATLQSIEQLDPLQQPSSSWNTVGDVQLVTDVQDFIRKYAHLKHEALYPFLTLWIFATHCYEHFEFMGYVILHSLIAQCGKTTLMDIMSMLVKNPGDRSVSQTAATVFREAGKYTQFLDEWDECSPERRQELAPILNGGFQAGTVVKRSDEGAVGTGRKQNVFAIYSPKIIAMVGDPGSLFKRTTFDRSFRIFLARQKRSEKRTKFRRMNPQIIADGAALKVRIEDWVKANEALVKSDYLNRAGTVPYLQDFADRTQDITEGLAAVLDNIAPNDLSLRRALITAINLTRDESVTTNRDCDVIAALLKLAQSHEGEVIGNSTELAVLLQQSNPDEGFTNNAVWMALKNHFKARSKDFNGTDRKRYVLKVAQLQAVLDGYGALKAVSVPKNESAQVATEQVALVQ